MAQLPDGSYHGATLSSFSSIALDPTPLISFSLRLPSRLADAITSPPTLTPTSSSAPSSPSSPSHSRPRIISISMLSSPLQPLAEAFSQARVDHEAILSDKSRWEGTPPLAIGSIGGIVCEVLKSVDLPELTEGKGEGRGMTMGPGEGATGTSKGISISPPATSAALPPFSETETTSIPPIKVTSSSLLSSSAPTPSHPHKQDPKSIDLSTPSTPTKQLTNQTQTPEQTNSKEKGKQNGSMLFIARVIEVVYPKRVDIKQQAKETEEEREEGNQEGRRDGDDEEGMKRPLLYCNRKYVGIESKPSVTIKSTTYTDTIKAIPT